MTFDKISSQEIADAGYRLNAGIMLLNKENQIFVGKRISHSQAVPYLENPEGWQMPQGGIDPGETPYQTAIRELKEEIGVTEVSFIAESQKWYTYKFPPELQPYLWNGRYHSQRQKWFLFRFEGKDTSINLNFSTPAEFSDWKWDSAAEVLDLIIGFKKDVYQKVLEEFKEFVG